MSRGEVGVEEGRGGEEKGREIGEGRWGEKGEVRRRVGEERRGGED